MQQGRDLSALPCRVCVGGRTNPAPAVYIGGRIARFPPSEMILMT